MAPNPYAPPAEPSLLAVDGGTPSIASERRSLAAMFLLSLVTLGVYPLVWIARRRPFLERLDAGVPPGWGLVLLAIGADVSSVAASFENEPISRMLGFVGSIVRLVAVFRVRAVLNTWAVREGAPGAPSGVATFFFGTLYLQDRLNRIARWAEHMGR